MGCMMLIPRAEIYEKKRFYLFIFNSFNSKSGMIFFFILKFSVFLYAY